jgi:phage FluMu protein gp41
MESGTLPLGVAQDGRRCRNFTLRPLQARDSLAVRHSPDGERIALIEATNKMMADELMGLALLGQRLSIDGVERKAMTLAAMERLWDEDLGEIMAAEGRLQEQLERFRGQSAPAVDAGAAQDGDTVAGGPSDAAGRGTAVGGGLGGAQGSEEGEGEGDGAPAP